MSYSHQDDTQFKKYLPNILILLRTTSIPLSLDAFNSNTASLNAGPRRCLARHKIVVVLPTPGGPAMIMLGTLPSLAKTANLDTVSSFPTISSNVFGRYFSIQGTCFSVLVPAFGVSPSIIYYYRYLKIKVNFRIFPLFMLWPH